VSAALDAHLEQAIQVDTHSTKADFVRDAVRRKLEDLGYHCNAFPLEQPPAEHRCSE